MVFISPCGQKSLFLLVLSSVPGAPSSFSMVRIQKLEAPAQFSWEPTIPMKVDSEF